MSRQPTESDTENGPEATPRSASPDVRSLSVPELIPTRAGSDLRRKLAAILAADVAGYTKLMAVDEEETLRRLEVYRGIFDQCVKRYDGRIFNTAGDAVLAEFASAVEAVRCAIDVQENLKTRNLSYVADRRMEFRIGITVGDVVERGSDLLGDGVNVAARLQTMAKPGGVCVSRWVYEQVGNKVGARFEDLGLRAAKNIPQPVHVYAILLHGEVPAAEQQVQAAVAAPAEPSETKVAAARSYVQPIAIGLTGVAIAAGFVVVSRLQSRPPAEVSVAVELPPKAVTAPARGDTPAPSKAVTAPAASAPTAKTAIAPAADEPARKSGGDIKQIFAMAEAKGKAATTAPVDSLPTLAPKKVEAAPAPVQPKVTPAADAGRSSAQDSPAPAAVPGWLQRMSASSQKAQARNAEPAAKETAKSDGASAQGISPAATKVEPPKAAPGKSQISKTEPLKSEPLKSEAAKSEPAKSETAKAERAPEVKPQSAPQPAPPSGSKDAPKDLHDVLAKVAHAQPGPSLPSILQWDRTPAQPSAAAPAQPEAKSKTAEPPASSPQPQAKAPAEPQRSGGWWAWLFGPGMGAAPSKTDALATAPKAPSAEWPSTAALPSLSYPTGAPTVPPPPKDVTTAPVVPVAVPAKAAPLPAPAVAAPPARQPETPQTVPAPTPTVSARPPAPSKALEKAPEKQPEASPEPRDRIAPAAPATPPPAAVAAPQQVRPAPSAPPPVARQAEESGPVNLFPELRETPRHTAPSPAASERRRGARSSICSEIIERAQVGALTDEDRQILQRDCRR